MISIRNLALRLAMTACLATTAAQAATTGTLRFSGQVDAGTCDLDAGDVNRSITLPTIKISDFDQAAYAGTLDFELSADCESDISSVTFLFTGTPAGEDASLFANTGTSGGTALWLAHRAPAFSIIPANGTPTQRSRTVATSNRKAVLPLTAAYHKTGAILTQGTLASTVTVSITYH